MPRNPQITYGFSMQDQSAETGRVQVYTDVPEDLVGGLSVAMSDFMLAVNAVTLGTVTKEQSGEVNKLSNVRIGAGNREDKMAVNYQDNVTRALVYAGELRVELGPKILDRPGRIIQILQLDDDLQTRFGYTVSLFLDNTVGKIQTDPKSDTRNAGYYQK